MLTSGRRTGANPASARPIALTAEEATLHHANANRSFRLKRCLEFIKSAGGSGCTTAELQSWTRSMAPATDVSELRQGGYIIDCVRAGTTKSGRKLYTYTYRGRKFA